MQESIIPLLTAITILGIITLLFFVNNFFRKYKIVKKCNPRKRKKDCILLDIPINEPEHIYRARSTEAERRWNDILKNKETKSVKNPVITVIKSVSYASKVALVVSDAKKSIDKLPKELSEKARIELADEIINACKLRISKIK